MNLSSRKPLERTGGCVCGAVRYTTVGEPERVTVCHCLWCQRRTGTAFGVELVFLPENIIFSGNDTKVHRHISDESDRWLDMHFCSECGTNLGFTLEIRAGIRTIPAGTYDDPGWIDKLDLEIRHVFTRSKRHWGDLSSALETHEAYFK